MQLAMVRAAQWHRVFIADLPAERARLSKRQMMRVRRLLGANQTRLRAYEFEVLLVAVAHGLCDGELAVAGLPAAADEGSAVPASATTALLSAGTACGIGSNAARSAARSVANPANLVSKADSTERASSAVRVFFARSMVLAQAVAAAEEAMLSISASMPSRSRADSSGARIGRWAAADGVR